ncbi:MAG TPA: TonB-dependent receptor [Phnomibacter sp.]|nr:TonB-dependent receptor [Phnomibacter sp.]
MRVLYLLIFVFTSSLLWGQPAKQGNVPAYKTDSTLANGSLRGTITDAVSGVPLAGATIYFPDLKLGTSSDEKGNYHFDQIVEGAYIAAVSYQGYASIVKTVSIQQHTVADFALSPSVVENENVVITGVSKATELRKTPIPISVVRKPELYRSSATNIIEALTRKSGVSSLSTGPAISKPIIRGMGYNRIITMNDGVRQEGQQWGDEHGIEIDEYSVQKAEILRGPASLMYGSDALGGVINILTNTPGPKGSIKANVVVSNNLNNHLWGLHGDVAGNVDGFSFSAYGSKKSAGDYQNKYDGYVLNSRFNEMNAGISAGIHRKWGYSQLILSNFDQHTGIIEGDRNDEGKFILYAGSPLERVATDDDLQSRSVFVPNQRIRHLKLVSSNSVKLGNNRLSAVLGYQRNQRQEFGDPEMPEEAEGWFDLGSFTYNAAMHFSEKKDWNTTVGLSGMVQNNRNKGEEAIIPDYNLLDAGVFVLSQKKLGNTAMLSGGIRFDNRNLDLQEMQDGNGGIKFSALQRNFSNVSGSVGISYFPSSSTTLKANVSRAFRAPNPAELASNGEHEGTGRYELGRSDLNSETSWQFDLGASFNTEHLNLGITPFVSVVEQFIYLEKLQSQSGGDSLTDVGNGDMATTYQYNQQHATLAGFEVNLDIHPHPLDWLHFENTLSYVKGWFATEVDYSKNLPQIPPFRLLSELRAELGKPNQQKLLANTYVKLEMDYNAAQKNPFTGYNTETSTGGYTLFNAGMGTDFKTKKGKTVASLFLSLNNIGDVAYQSHLSRLKYTAENMATGRTGVYNMGRNFTVRAVVPLEWTVK